MNNILFRRLMASLFHDLNFYYGDNTGDFGEYTYKVNYQVKNCDDIECQRTYQIDIDVYSKDTIEKENICNQIEELLNYKRYEIEEHSAEFIFVNRYDADEKNIYRTTMSHEIRTW